MKIFQRISVLFLGVCFIGFVGCSGSDEAKKNEEAQKQNAEFSKTDQGETPTPKTVTPPDVKPVEKELPQTEKEIPQQQEPPKVTKEESPAMQTQPTQKSGSTMWSVQIGAFKNEAGALQLASEAKMKFNQPIYKDFDPVTGFYKVTVGSFSTHDQVSKYKLEVQSKGYPDAFAVEVRR